MKTQAIIFALVVVILSGCATSQKPEFLSGVVAPGDITHTVSQTDGNRYTRMEPGWLPPIGKIASAWNGSPFRIGAIKYNDGPMRLLVQRNAEITRITGITINTDDEVNTWQQVGETKFVPDDSGNYNSISEFEVPEDTVKRMIADETRKVYIKVHTDKTDTGKGYIEADFKASCDPKTKWWGWACQGVRRFMENINS